MYWRLYQIDLPLLTSCKSALIPHYPPPTPGVFFLLTLLMRCSGVSLTLCCFVVYSTRRFVLYLTVCYFVIVFFSPFSIAITSLGEERANRSVFCTFLFACLFFVAVSLSSWCLGRAGACDCGTLWTFLLPFLITFS